MEARGHDEGSIPARAGEPFCVWLDLLWDPVYPRACGGTRRPRRKRGQARGLSPRVRGNRRVSYLRWQATGSIPARAGEPDTRRYECECQWVYPRACGGTTSASARSRLASGLSPRVRGNPTKPFRGVMTRGSIPARAGEPSNPGGSIPRRPVYPRACGGTTIRPRRAGGPDGLSPRVRGNLIRVGPAMAVYGSIPARAGEPWPGYGLEADHGVYPRACGGTVAFSDETAAQTGLSPRVRGNRSRAGQGDRAGGSIPARAGEPSSMSSFAS